MWLTAADSFGNSVTVPFSLCQVIAIWQNQEYQNLLWIVPRGKIFFLRLQDNRSHTAHTHTQTHRWSQTSVTQIQPRNVGLQRFKPISLKCLCCLCSSTERSLSAIASFKVSRNSSKVFSLLLWTRQHFKLEARCMPIQRQSLASFRMTNSWHVAEIAQSQVRCKHASKGQILLCTSEWHIARHIVWYCDTVTKTPLLYDIIDMTWSKTLLPKHQKMFVAWKWCRFWRIAPWCQRGAFREYHGYSPFRAISIFSSHMSVPRSFSPSTGHELEKHWQDIIEFWHSTLLNY